MIIRNLAVSRVANKLFNEYMGIFDFISELTNHYRIEKRPKKSNETKKICFKMKLNVTFIAAKEHKFCWTCLARTSTH